MLYFKNRSPFREWLSIILPDDEKDLKSGMERFAEKKMVKKLKQRAS